MAVVGNVELLRAPRRRHCAQSSNEGCCEEGCGLMLTQLWGRERYRLYRPDEAAQLRVRGLHCLT